MILLITTSLFAKAQTDVQLEAVDALIEERRINEALALVEEYIRANPKDFDNAQKRIDIIFQARDDYKAKADELVQIIVEDPLNDRLKLEIIDELETMEANPNEEEREFIAKIKVTSQFTYFRALYEQIIEDGTELLNQKDYFASASRFTDGFELYYEDFFERNFDSALVEEVLVALETANASVRDYGQIQSSFTEVFEQYNAFLIQNNTGASLSQYEDVMQALNDFAQIRNASILTGLYFKDQTGILQEQDPELTDAFFLAFAYRILLGRGDDSEADIVKAMDTQWIDAYEETKVNLSQMLAYFANDLNQSLVALSSNQIVSSATTIRSKLDTIQSIIDMGESFLAQYELLNNTATTFETNPYTEYEDLLEYNAYLVTQGNTLLNYANTLAREREQVAIYPIPQNPNTVITARDSAYTTFLASSAQTTETNAQDIDNSIQVFDQENTSIENISYNFSQSESILYPTLSDLALTLQNHMQSLSTQNYNDSLLAWENISSFVADGSAIIRENYNTPYSTAISLINEGLDISFQSDPLTALSTLEGISNSIDKDIASIQLQYDFLGTSSQNIDVGVSQSNLFAQNSNNVLQDIAFLSELSVSSQNYATLANQRIRLAQQAQNEANLRLSQAEEYLDQENFAASRDALQRARTKYNESLTYQFTEELQESSDEALAILGEEISYIENEIIVQNVRNFITQSRQNYYNSNFAQAETLILQAESQWAITNIQENPEIVTLKALIGNALSITTGRTIPPTDPLYPEMSQTLNVAYQHYDNAENLLARNNRSQALSELELARNKIRDVQVLYPFHQEASLLALQIDELIDPEAFQEQFVQKFEQAQSDYRDPATSSRAYIDLLDLYEINPNYPGLEDFIYVVELELGIILPPPNLAAIAQSDTLTQQASNIYDSGARDEISLNNALALLNEAIDLNAENQSALILLDRINTSLGGATVIVLSSEAENLYQQAVLELSNGNTITAAALVTQLLQLPGVENSSKIIDLQQRVESLL